MSIRFVYFDLGNVLLSFSHERGFSQIAQAAGIEIESVRSAIVGLKLGDRYECGELSTEEFHAEFCAATKTSLELAELSEAWGGIFETMPRTTALAASLVNAGYRIGILSNTCEIHWNWAAKRFRALSTFFSPIITSYEAQAMKPAAAIYELATARAETPANEILFIDDLADNVAGAKQAGWQAIQFSSALQVANDLEAAGLTFNR